MLIVKCHDSIQQMSNNKKKTNQHICENLSVFLRTSINIYCIGHGLS